MKKLQIFGNSIGYAFDFDYYYDRQINVFIEEYDSVKQDDSINILFLVAEPAEVMHDAYKFAISNWDKFDFIFTHDEKVLQCQNSVLFEFGSNWVNPDGGTQDRIFGVSTVVGKKNSCTGHKLRQVLWKNQEKITTPRVFYQSHLAMIADDYPNNPVLYGDKDPLFETMFSVVIENTRAGYYFSEKLIDCLYKKTIPIYWGCPKISNYFNMNSIVETTTLEEIINACNQLTPDFYFNNKENIEENFQIAQKWSMTRLKDRFIEKLDELFKGV